MQESNTNYTIQRDEKTGSPIYQKSGRKSKYHLPTAYSKSITDRTGLREDETLIQIALEDLMEYFKYSKNKTSQEKYQKLSFLLKTCLKIITAPAYVVDKIFTTDDERILFKLKTALQKLFPKEYIIGFIINFFCALANNKNALELTERQRQQIEKTLHRYSSVEIASLGNYHRSLLMKIADLLVKKGVVSNNVLSPAKQQPATQTQAQTQQSTGQSGLEQMQKRKRQIQDTVPEEILPHKKVQEFTPSQSSDNNQEVNNQEADLDETQPYIYGNNEYLGQNENTFIGQNENTFIGQNLDLSDISSNSGGKLTISGNPADISKLMLHLQNELNKNQKLYQSELLA
jgi:hypothetical protein